MKTLIAVLMLGSVAFAQERAPQSEGPVLDSAGRLVAYVFPDGTREQYAYDSLWRMTRFVDRQGGVTTFVYNADGSMATVHPDGSTDNGHSR